MHFRSLKHTRIRHQFSMRFNQLLPKLFRTIGSRQENWKRKPCTQISQITVNLVQSYLYNNDGGCYRNNIVTATLRRGQKAPPPVPPDSLKSLSYLSHTPRCKYRSLRTTCAALRARNRLQDRTVRGQRSISGTGSSSPVAHIIII